MMPDPYETFHPEDAAPWRVIFRLGPKFFADSTWLQTEQVCVEHWLHALRCAEIRVWKDTLIQTGMEVGSGKEHLARPWEEGKAFVERWLFPLWERWQKMLSFVPFHDGSWARERVENGVLRILSPDAVEVLKTDVAARSEQEELLWRFLRARCQSDPEKTRQLEELYQAHVKLEKGSEGWQLNPRGQEDAAWIVQTLQRQFR
ncbi:hypothetical protein [Alicyclobacillus tolerans]|uniref:Uncharacterized protein n=1 Tax=Alicyclobacillus tolerans TaxID=90970 RepID=A0A1M6X378_9BACL|nr:hypothetical protein [Alicyclobacillus montanus]SHL00393.1 hypothetical protein SAMN05443507_13120 [Alicyclobacillus montanus]